MPVVTAIGISVNIHDMSRENQDRIQAAMADEVLRCNAEGISNEECNSAIINDRVLAVRDRLRARIDAEVLLVELRQGVVRAEQALVQHERQVEESRRAIREARAAVARQEAEPDRLHRHHGPVAHGGDAGGLRHPGDGVVLPAAVA